MIEGILWIHRLGLPIDFKIAGGQVDDSIPAIELLEEKNQKML